MYEMIFGVPYDINLSSSRHDLAFTTLLALSLTIMK